MTGRKKKSWYSNQKIMFLDNRKCLTMKCLGCHTVFVETHQDVTVNDIFIVDSPSFYRLCNDAELPFFRHSTLVLTCFIHFFFPVFLFFPSFFFKF